MPRDPDDSQELISTGVAAKMLGVGRKAIRNYIERGDLEAVRLPTGFYRVKRSSVLRLLERGRLDE